MIGTESMAAAEKAGGEKRSKLEGVVIGKRGAAVDDAKDSRGVLPGRAEGQRAAGERTVGTLASTTSKARGGSRPIEPAGAGAEQTTSGGTRAAAKHAGRQAGDGGLDEASGGGSRGPPIPLEETAGGGTRAAAKQAGGTAGGGGLDEAGSGGSRGPPIPLGESADKAGDGADGGAEALGQVLTRLAGLLRPGGGRNRLGTQGPT